MADVAVIMGSKSDLDTMKGAKEILDMIGLATEVTIVSAHRTPDRLFEYARSARSRGIKVIIAGAGGAAHLPGMVASLTTLPVIGVPILSRNSIDGWDSILSILQMPSGIPVATVALNNSANAGLLAARMLGALEPAVAEKLEIYADFLKNKVLDAAKKVEKDFNE